MTPGFDKSRQSTRKTFFHFKTHGFKEQSVKTQGFKIQSGLA